MANITGLGDTIYAAVKKAINDAGDSGSGSGGGGGESTIDVLMWNITQAEYADRRPTMVAYISGLEGAHTQLQFEPITTEVEGITVYGIKVKNCPVGASFDGLSFGFGNGAVFDGVSFGYSQSDFGFFTPSRTATCPMPIDGFYVVGNYAVSGLH